MEKIAQSFKFRPRSPLSPPRVIWAEKRRPKTFFLLSPPWLLLRLATFTQRGGSRPLHMRAREKNAWTTKMALLNIKIPFFR